MSNEEQIIELLKENRELLEKTYRSAEKTRKYFLYSAIATVVIFALPLIAALIYLPSIMETYMNSLGGNLSF